MLTGIQMRRPDIAYLTKAQVANTKIDIDEIPEFVIEVISTTDNHYKLEDKISEYFMHGVQVVWIILPELKMVNVYTTRKTVKICTDDDICSANPVLPEFEISVNLLFA